MKLIFTSYVSTLQCSDPDEWLKRIESYTGILESLAERHDVRSIERINYSGELEKNGVKYFFVKFRSQVNRFPFAMHRFIKSCQPDVVFVNGFFPFQVIQLRMTLGKGVKIIILHRAEKPFKGFKKYLQKIADRYIHAYLFVSSEFGRQWEEAGNISASKGHEVIQASSVFHPADKQSAKNKLSIEGLPVFIWVGRLNANKDPLTAVKAFLDFSKRSPAAKLYMIYQSDELLKEVKTLIGSNEAILLVGKVEHNDLQEWYNSADFIISTSHYEGSGIAVAEGMSCGCVPIVSDIISYRKMVSGCGLIFTPGDHEELLSCLSSALNLDIESKRAEVLKQFNDELSFEAIARKIDRIIES